MRGASVAMKWLRSNARRLSLLALFALALQFGLSFGHFHADRLAGAAAISNHASASTPDSGHDQDNPDDFCAICATIAMADTLVDAVPPLADVAAGVRDRAGCAQSGNRRSGFPPQHFPVPRPSVFLTSTVHSSRGSLPLAGEASG